MVVGKQFFLIKNYLAFGCMKVRVKGTFKKLELNNLKITIIKITNFVRFIIGLCSRVL